MFFPVAGDSYYDSVSLLLPMTGGDNSTVFYDISKSKRTVSRFGDAKISTTQSKFGAGSGYFDGNGDYLTIADSEDFSFGTSPFTVEFWIYTPATPDSADGIINQGTWSSPTLSFSIYYNGSLQTVLRLSNAFNQYVIEIVSAANNSLDTWHHMAVSIVPASGDAYTAFDGTVTLTNFAASITVPNSTLNLEIGRLAGEFGGHAYLNAYIQDLRITKGVARYTSNFLVPSAPLNASLLERPLQRTVWQPTHSEIARLGL